MKLRVHTKQQTSNHFSFVFCRPFHLCSPLPFSEVILHTLSFPSFYDLCPSHLPFIFSIFINSLPFLLSIFLPVSSYLLNQLNLVLVLISLTFLAFSYFFRSIFPLFCSHFLPLFVHCNDFSETNITESLIPCKVIYTIKSKITH